MEKELFGLKDENGKEYKLRIESYREGFTISAILPVEDKPKFKVGQWVCWTGTRPTIGRIKKHCPEFTDSWELSDTPKDSTGNYNSCSEDYLRFATNDEIKNNLIHVAKSKGFKGGLKLHRVNDLCANYIRDERVEEWMYDSRLDRLQFNGTGIYEKGSWAEILSEKKKLPRTKEEAKQFLTEYYSNGNMMNFLEQYED